MAAEGIGVGLLPNEYCAPLIESGKLRVVPVNRVFDFEFFAVCSADGEQSLPGQVAELARQSSTFRRLTD
jgi:hypothetical protein